MNPKFLIIIKVTVQPTPYPIKKQERLLGHSCLYLLQKFVFAIQ